MHIAHYCIHRQNIIAGFISQPPTKQARIILKIHRVAGEEKKWTGFVFFVDRFYIALYSALEQADCARMWFYMID